jgi:hypothetical protein
MAAHPLWHNFAGIFNQSLGVSISPNVLGTIVEINAESIRTKELGEVYYKNLTEVTIDADLNAQNDLEIRSVDEDLISFEIDDVLIDPLKQAKAIEVIAVGLTCGITTMDDAADKDTLNVIFDILRKLGGSASIAGNYQSTYKIVRGFTAVPSLISGGTGASEDLYTETMLIPFEDPVVFSKEQKNTVCNFTFITNILRHDLTAFGAAANGVTIKIVPTLFFRPTTVAQNPIVAEISELFKSRIMGK